MPGVRATIKRLIKPYTPQKVYVPWEELDLRRLGRVLTHAILVGALSGLFACLFFYALDWIQYFLIEGLAQVERPLPGGEIHITPERLVGPPRLIVLALLPAVGGLLSGIVVYFAGKEAGGAGGDAYIDAFHNKKGLIRGRVPIVKSIASLLTIGTGGSAGREGPALQVCAGLASSLSQRLRLSESERRILMVAGAAAGTGAIFQTPLGGALYAVEVLYRDDFETDAIIPSVLASVTGYSIFTMVYGHGHLFTTAPNYPFIPAALPFYALMAVGLSVFAAIFVKMRYSLKRYFEGLRIPAWSVAGFGGLLVGLLALAVPQALGTGYGWVQGAIDIAPWIPTGHRGWMLLMGLALAKMLATSLTLGSGGSGGEFGPTLVIGGFAGCAFGLIFHSIAPATVPQPGAFALVGMAAMLGGVAHVPVSSLIMVCELAGSYDLLVPLMLCEGITFVLLRRITIFHFQTATRLQSPAHRDERIVDVLESMSVRDFFHRGEHLASLPAAASLADVMHALSESDHPAVIVTGSAGERLGIISLDVLQAALHEDEVLLVAMAADVYEPLPPLDEDADLHAALRAFLTTGASVLPVFDKDDREVGILSLGDVTLAYDEAVKTRLIEKVPESIRPAG